MVDRQVAGEGVAGPPREPPGELDDQAGVRGRHVPRVSALMQADQPPVHPGQLERHAGVLGHGSRQALLHREGPRRGHLLPDRPQHLRPPACRGDVRAVQDDLADRHGQRRPGQGQDYLAGPGQRAEPKRNHVLLGRALPTRRHGQQQPIGVLQQCFTLGGPGPGDERGLSAVRVADPHVQSLLIRPWPAHRPQCQMLLRRRPVPELHHDLQAQAAGEHPSPQQRHRHLSVPAQHLPNRQDRRHLVVRRAETPGVRTQLRLSWRPCINAT